MSVMSSGCSARKREGSDLMSAAEQDADEVAVGLAGLVQERK